MRRVIPHYPPLFISVVSDDELIVPPLHLVDVLFHFLDISLKDFPLSISWAFIHLERLFYFFLSEDWLFLLFSFLYNRGFHTFLDTPIFTDSTTPSVQPFIFYPYYAHREGTER